ncbi:MAG: extracellular solute-binding protein [Balneolaceae bacterium]|nr:extracellular solute-binding protein [Balneolaceae bacterium]
MTSITYFKPFSAKHFTLTLGIALGASVASAQDSDVTISHYFSDELGQAALQQQIRKFESETGYRLVPSNTGHEDFKTSILVRAAGNSLPDVFSYWAGAGTQNLVDSGALRPIDDVWSEYNLDSVVAPSIAEGATLYDGTRYLIPFNYHYSGFFYNTKVMSDAGITEMPENWDEFLSMIEQLQDAGITPFALGSQNRWPAQFWFDYILLRTAGPEYRSALMNGDASYDDPEVLRVMEIWKDLFDKGAFAPNSNAQTWTDAANRVARGQAAMTLMGTWITGYWNGLELQPVTDYNVFPFPVIDAGVPNAVVGPIDGLVMAHNANNIAGARAFLGEMMANSEIQQGWTSDYGALSANINVDTSQYNAVIQKAVQLVAESDTFVFNYDLATPPSAAEVGLSMFAEFINSPSDYERLMERVSRSVASSFGN